MNELRSLPDKNCPAHTLQNLKEGENRVQNLKATTSNMNNSDPQNLNPRNLRAVRKVGPLIYPRRLSEEQRKAADRLLNQFSVNEQQRLLDEMEDRIRAEK